MAGHIHSIDSFGTVDGPGVRMVIFTKGCPMRCLYCHNPDTWDPDGGTDMTVDEIMKMYNKSRSFYKSGGITVSGGEPLLQIDFVTELFEAAKAQNIHTCLDTSGITFNKNDAALIKKFERLINATDLVLLDIKHIDNDRHIKLCGHPNKSVLDFSRFLEEKNIPVCIRHVVVPGYTDEEEYLFKLGEFIGTLKNVNSLDVLPYHSMGKEKYRQLGIDYLLESVSPLSKEEALKARNTILRGIKSTRKKV